MPVKVRILSMIKEDESNHHLNPYLYTIEVTHGPQNWMIKKRYKHFFKLHNSIRFQFVDNEPKDENKVKMYRVTQTKIYFFGPLVVPEKSHSFGESFYKFGNTVFQIND